MDDPTGVARSRVGAVLNAVSGESTTLQFQVKFMADLDPSQIDYDPSKATVMIVDPTDVDDDHEQLVGKTVVGEKGVIIVQWSNERSWVRARVLQNFKVQVNRK